MKIFVFFLFIYLFILFWQTVSLYQLFSVARYVRCLRAEGYDTKSNVKLGRFQSQLQASYVSSHTEVLWYNKTVCLNKINK